MVLGMDFEGNASKAYRVLRGFSSMARAIVLKRLAFCAIQSGFLMFVRSVVWIQAVEPESADSFRKHYVMILEMLESFVSLRSTAHSKGTFLTAALCVFQTCLYSRFQASRRHSLSAHSLAFDCCGSRSASRRILDILRIPPSPPPVSGRLVRFG